MYARKFHWSFRWIVSILHLCTGLPLVLGAMHRSYGQTKCAKIRCVQSKRARAVQRSHMSTSLHWLPLCRKAALLIVLTVAYTVSMGAVLFAAASSKSSSQVRIWVASQGVLADAFQAALLTRALGGWHRLSDSSAVPALQANLSEMLIVTLALLVDLRQLSNASMASLCGLLPIMGRRPSELSHAILASTGCLPSTAAVAEASHLQTVWMAQILAVEGEVRLASTPRAWAVRACAGRMDIRALLRHCVMLCVLPVQGLVIMTAVVMMTMVILAKCAYDTSKDAFLAFLEREPYIGLRVASTAWLTPVVHERGRAKGWQLAAQWAFTILAATLLAAIGACIWAVFGIAVACMHVLLARKLDRATSLELGAPLLVRRIGFMVQVVHTMASVVLWQPNEWLWAICAALPEVCCCV